MNEIVALVIGAALVNNAVLGAMLGLDRARADDAVVFDSVVFGTLVALATTLAAAIFWPLARIVPFGDLVALAGTALVLVVAASTALVAQLVERAFAPLAPVMHGRWLAVAGNAAVIGGVLMALRPGRSYAQTLAVAFASGAGYVLVLAMLAAMRRRFAHDDVPLAFRGLPLDLLTAGFMALAFMGFAGVAPTP
jgi:electron transport complex protein RnfA